MSKTPVALDANQHLFPNSIPDTFEILEQALNQGHQICNALLITNK